MAPLYLGLDSSTQSLKGIVINVEKGTIVCEVTVDFNDFEDAYGTKDGIKKTKETGGRSGERVWSYPQMWLEALDRLCEKLRDGLKDKKRGVSEIAAISGSGQQHGTVWLGKTAESLLGRLPEASSLKDGLSGMFSRRESPIWMDSSTGREVSEIEENVGGRDELLQLTGNVGFERFSGPQIRRIFKEEPEVYKATAHICLVSSFMASVLAGRVVPIDHGDGAGMNLMDIQTREWSQPALKATADGLQGKLIAVQATDTIAGPISPYFHKYGFSQECQIALWSGDNPCSLIGLGLARPGAAAMSLGTSDVLFATMDGLGRCDSGEGATFVSPAGPYMGLAVFANGGLTRKAVRDQFRLTWDDFASLLDRSSAGNYEPDEEGRRGAKRIMLPYFRPEIAPKVPQPLVVYHRLLPTDAEGCVRGVVESRALAARLHSQWMGGGFTSLRATGGGARNAAIVRVFANVFGLPVEVLETTSSAALGAALMAWHSHQKPSWEHVVAPFTKPMETIQPDPASVAVYAEMLDEFKQIEERHSR